jgi:diguanylate cyclase (GGDEF)-like protein
MKEIFLSEEWEKTKELIETISKEYAIFDKKGKLLTGKENIPFKKVETTDICDGIIYIYLKIKNKETIFAAKPEISIDKTIKIIKKTVKLLNLFLEKKENKEELEIKCEYTKSIQTKKNINELITTTAEFFMQTFKLANCSINLNEKKFRFFETKTKEIYDDVERILEKQSQNLKSPGKIKNTQEDFLLKNIEDIEKIPEAIFYIPILIEKKHSGTIFCYTDKIDEESAGKAESITKEFTNSIKRITELQEAKTNSQTDSLTKLKNRTGLFEQLEKKIEKNQKEKKATSIIIFDIDNFKKYNDERGHLAGDEILKKISEEIQKIKKLSETYRYGGEEFVTILDQTDFAEVKNTAEELRQAIEKNSELTISVGCATCSNSTISGKRLLEEADKALYKAKKTGKNKVIQFIIIDQSLGVLDTSEN